MAESALAHARAKLLPDVSAEFVRVRARSAPSVLLEAAEQHQRAEEEGDSTLERGHGVRIGRSTRSLDGLARTRGDGNAGRARRPPP